MSIHDFKALNDVDQMHYWLDEGQYLAMRYIGHYIIKLYAVDRFFVEAWHRPDLNQLERLASFSSGKQLEVYLHSIKLAI